MREQQEDLRKCYEDYYASQHFTSSYTFCKQIVCRLQILKQIQRNALSIARTAQFLAHGNV